MFLLPTELSFFRNVVGRRQEQMGEELVGQEADSAEEKSCTWRFW